jgi:hypothetical protein
MKKILWIASYPKSGNTLMRAIISSLVYTEDGVFDFDLFKKISLLDTNPFYDFVKNLNIDDYNNLNNLKISSKYWKTAQQKFEEKTSNIIFKTHAANLMYGKNKYTTSNTSFGAIYLIRDPRDIPSSYSYHQEKSIDGILSDMINKSTTITNPKMNISVPLSSWDVHVKSWELLETPKLIIKFEDLVNNTKKIIEVVSNFLEFLKIEFSCNNMKVENIYKSTQFKKLKSEEEEKGYPLGTNKNFFRKGLTKNHNLNKIQIQKILDNFESTMKKYNYL